MSRFIGNIDAKSDVKGRVFVPASFRKIIQSMGDEQLILRKDIYQDCLILYPSSVWIEELNHLRSTLDKYDEEQQNLYRAFAMNIEMLNIDSNGRILIPKRYMQMAHIDSEVRFVGMDNTIEIWSKEKLEKPLMDSETFKENVKKYLVKGKE